MKCKALVLTHSNLAEAFVRAVHLIFGDVELLQYKNLPDAFFVNVKAGKTVCVRQELSEELYYCRLYPLQQEALSLAVCSEDKELAEQLIWLTLPEEFSETEESEQKE